MELILFLSLSIILWRLVHVLWISIINSLLFLSSIPRTSTSQFVYWSPTEVHLFPIWGYYKYDWMNNPHPHPQHVQLWIPSICECYVLRQRLRICDEGILRWKDHPGSSGWPISAITGHLMRERRELTEDKWSRCKTRNTGSLVETGRVKQQNLFPRGPRGSVALLTPWPWPNDTNRGFLASGTVIE